MNRQDKINLIQRITGGQTSIYDLHGYVFIIQKDEKNYLSQGKTISREITEKELDLIKCPKIFIDEQDLSV